MFIDDRSVQRVLKITPDGDWGDKSKATARTAVSKLPKTKTTYQSTWSDEQVRIAIEQWMMTKAGIDVGIADGVPGARTIVGKEKWQDYITFVRKSPNPTAGVAKATVWPTLKTALKFYGKPGTNHIKIDPPYPVFYGTQEVSSITLNKKCAESGLKILEAVLAHYGNEEICKLGLDRYGGSYNNRPMRNGSTLSTHAYAAAWDWDPERNQLRENHRTARFARPEYKAFIDAHEAEGWISLGRARDMDYMHFQAVRL